MQGLKKINRSIDNLRNWLKYYKKQPKIMKHFTPSENFIYVSFLCVYV